VVTRLPTEHAGVVMAMDASADGRHLAIADLAGDVVVHDLDGKNPPARFRVVPAAESIAIAPDGKRVVVGVASSKDSPPALEVWDASKGIRLATRRMAAPVRAVAVSADGSRMAHSGGLEHEVLVEPLPLGVVTERSDADAASATRRGLLRLGGVGRRVQSLAFSDDGEDAAPRLIGVRWQAVDKVAAAAPLAFDEIFDFENLAIVDPTAAGEETWAPSDGGPAGWSIRRSDRHSAGVETWTLVRDGAEGGSLSLSVDWQGRLGPERSCVAWIRKDVGDGEPHAVALGTDRGIFVFRITDEGECPLVRRYRGHEDGVTSLAVSRDMRWLASGGRDGIVMLWPLAGLDGDPLFDRWGAVIAAEEGRAVVRTADDSGPLAGKGVIAGDGIVSVSSLSDGEDGGLERSEASGGPAVRDALATCEWSVQMAIVTEREGTRRDPFNRQPAWENVAAIHLSENREWAFWSPRGYYAASANGDTLFGWLVNRGLDRLPRFFRAAQFRRRLERPDVMSRLLAAGSLQRALDQTRRDVPESSSTVLPSLIVSTPDVRIISPGPVGAVGGPSVRVRASVESLPGVEVTEVKAYASGVASREAARLVDERPALDDAPGLQTYEWDLRLPSEDSQLIQVAVATADGATEIREVAVAVRDRASPRRRPRLHLLAAGVDRYKHSASSADSGLSDLAFAAKDAFTLRQSITGHSIGLSDIGYTSLLINDAVDREQWKKTVEDLVTAVGDDVEPDDLVVVVLAGHGMSDPTRGYSFLCHDVQMLEKSGDFVPSAEGTLTWHDFTAIAALPCRKVALVDTCHSGGFGPASRGSRVRDFQEHMIVVLAASADHESSQESDAWGHGAFTKVFLEALDGGVDGRRVASGSDRGDGVIRFNDIVDYVVSGVPRLTADSRSASSAGTSTRNDVTQHRRTSSQHPTVSPASLLPYLTVPLSGASRTDRNGGS
ncbi:MAG: hypothetical protein ACKOCN_09775, partial [Planctomycetaceae bacterium]